VNRPFFREPLPPNDVAVLNDFVVNAFGSASEFRMLMQEINEERAAGREPLLVELNYRVQTYQKHPIYSRQSFDVSVVVCMHA
jgi:hypothetical protein